MNTARLAAILLEDQADHRTGNPWGRVHEALDPNWEPSPDILRWFQGLLSGPNPRLVWGTETSGQTYIIDKVAKTVKLVGGSTADPKAWHAKNRIVFQRLGYKMIEPDRPDEIAFAESQEHNYKSLLRRAIGLKK